MKIVSAFIAFLILQSCSFFGVNFSKEDEVKVREMVDNSTINITYRENHDRIFANYFYDMSNNIDRKQKNTPISTNVSVVFTEVPSGIDRSGTIMYYEIVASIPYFVKIDTKKNKIDEVVLEVEKYKKFQSQRQKFSNQKEKTREKMIFSNRVIGSQSYAGSPADLFAEYVAQINAKENLAKVVAREFYYGLMLNLRLHIMQCRKIKNVLMQKRFFVFANEDDKTSEEDVSEYLISDIDINTVKRRDYLIYEDACTFF